MTAAIREVTDGVELDVLVVPRASRSKIVGLHDDRIKVQLAAPPVDGAANAELVVLLAGFFDVAARAVVLVRGATSKRKTVRIVGVTATAARAALDRRS